jgi:hypothetical protein
LKAEVIQGLKGDFLISSRSSSHRYNNIFFPVIYGSGSFVGILNGSG